MNDRVASANLFGHITLLAGILIAGISLSLRFPAPYFWLVLLALVGIVCWRVFEILRYHPLARHRRPTYTATFLVLPILLTLGTGLFIRLVAAPGWIAVGLLISGLFLAGVVIALYHTVDRHDRFYATSRFLVNLASYLIAFSLFSAIYDARLRSLQSATSITLVTALLALDLFNDSETRTWRTLLYAVLTGFIVGQITWSLNWLSLSGLAGGVVLLLAFYVVTGVIQSAFLARLTKATVLEFAGVTLAGLVVLLGIGTLAR